jgi:3-deoxy-D-manno-octulosonate 8-phosphate phosphatase (KDO 8-P phosphatase)
MMADAENRQFILEKARKLKLLILDVDGVLTDGKLFFDNQGNEYKTFHAQDGHGIKLLRKTGVEVAVISGRKSTVVE